jgi:hypothetical protein
MRNLFRLSVRIFIETTQNESRYSLDHAVVQNIEKSRSCSINQSNFSPNPQLVNIQSASTELKQFSEVKLTTPPVQRPLNCLGCSSNSVQFLKIISVTCMQTKLGFQLIDFVLFCDLSCQGDNAKF